MAINDSGWEWLKRPLQAGEQQLDASPLSLLSLVREEGRPKVGAGTTYSDIIRDEYPDDIRFHLGPRLRRADVFPEPREVPSTDVAGAQVRVENVGADPEFALRMRKEMDGLPANVRKVLADNDFRVTVADKIEDAAPDLRGTKPRGWPEGTTFANEDGAFRPDKRQILISDTFKDTSGKQIHSGRSEGVLRHEAGHAFDAALGNISQQTEFKDAYAKDVAVMPPEVKARLGYLLQPDGAGEQETFAEIFAALNGGSANADQTARILQYLPEAVVRVRALIASPPEAHP